MKKLIVVALLSSMVPLCAMEESGSGSEDEGGFITGIVTTPSPARPQARTMSKHSRGGSRSDEEVRYGMTSFLFGVDERAYYSDDEEEANGAERADLGANALGDRVRRLKQTALAARLGSLQERGIEVVGLWNRLGLQDTDFAVLEKEITSLEARPERAALPAPVRERTGTVSPSPARPQGLEMSKDSRGGSRSDEEEEEKGLGADVTGDRRLSQALLANRLGALLNSGIEVGALWGRVGHQDTDLVVLEKEIAALEAGSERVASPAPAEERTGTVSPSPAVLPASEDAGLIGDQDDPKGEGLGGGGGARVLPSPIRVPEENPSVSHRWYNPKSPVLRIAVPTSLAAVIMGGYLTRRHVKKQRALGKPTVFDRMWSKSKQWKKKAERFASARRSPR